MKVLRLLTLLILCTAALVWDAFLAGAMIERLHMNDFGKFYYSAQAFLDGRDMYGPTPATDPRFVQAEEVQFLNMNPPHFHLLVLPLARLQPKVAVGLWMGASIFALVLTILLVLRELEVDVTPVRLLLLAFGSLAFGGTQAFFVTGQLSMILLLAMTICWLDARHGRWLRAAGWLGVCLSIKPFLLIFLPYLAGTRRFRALSVALAVSAACFAVGLLVFGVSAYEAWYQALGGSGDWAWTPMNASIFAVFRRSLDATPFFAAAIVRPEMVRLWLVAAAMVGLVTVFVVIADRTRAATDRAFALLLLSAQLISPLGWVYYLWLPAGPAAALVWRSGQHVPERHWPSRVLTSVTMIGFWWPLTAIGLFQPSRWATPTIGSAYFWATLAAWLWLVADYSSAAKSSSSSQL